MMPRSTRSTSAANVKSYSVLLHERMTSDSFAATRLPSSHGFGDTASLRAGTHKARAWKGRHADFMENRCYR